MTMRRGAKPTKSKAKGKPPAARKSLRNDGSRVRDLERRLAEALEQQTATSEILRVIASSPTDVEPVLMTVAERAARLCDANDALIFRKEGNGLRALARWGSVPTVMTPETVLTIDRTFVASRAVIDARVVHIPDVQAAFDEFPGSKRYMGVTGVRTVLAVPLLREGVAIGAILIRRLEVEPFTDKQIGLVTTFADQAVIAIENVRLFTELQQKNGALTQAHAQVSESLEQQTATAEILRAISSSPTDIQPAFDIIAESAVRLCGAEASTVTRFDGEWVRLVAVYGSSPEGVDAVRRSYPMHGGGASAAARSIRDRAIVHIPDVLVDEGYGVPEAAVASGFRATLAVPMLREGRAIGAIAIGRSEPGEFSERQIELLRTFADQALIAIEIVRLISQSQTDVQPVFDTIVRSAVRLCDGLGSVLYQFDGELIHQIAQHNYTPEALETAHRIFPARPTRTLGTGRAILERAVVHIPDVEVDPEYQHHALSRVVGYRSGLWVPMLREGAPIGVIVVTRAEAGPFSDSEIELLKTFADQAVIAVENVRLFKELQARTGELTQSVEKLTALGEVSRAVSSTLDVETVLDTI